METWVVETFETCADAHRCLDWAGLPRFMETYPDVPLDADDLCAWADAYVCTCWENECVLRQ